ncbi:MAG TPA: zf-HC2 domain-containing protein [Syntrophomonas sp.]|nr:zf-HC2 domain-containing protein [Syntrophomonas sp.]
MNCEQMQTLFSPYLDKMTNNVENEAIEEHLGECELCAHKLEEMGRICAMLKNLDTPQIPINFGESIHNRISHEKIKIFPASPLGVPKRTGWVAATVAGLAISAGIFAGSYLPYGAMVASLQDWMNKDTRPHIAIVDNNKILQDWLNKHSEDEQTENGGQVTDPAGQSDDKTPGTAKPGNNTGTSPTITKPVQVAVQEKVEQNYTAKIQVDNMDKSMQDVMQLAYASGAQISVKSANVMAAAAESVKVVTMQVPKDKAGALLSELGGVGVEAPLQNSIAYTEAYTENQKALASVDENIQKLQSSASLNDEQQTQLQDLLKQKQDLQAKQERIDKAVDAVTIEVRLVEKTDS